MNYIRISVEWCIILAILGYHVYKDVWEASHGELLNCTRETGNSFDPFSVCVEKHGNIVSHSQEKFLQSVRCFCGVAGPYNVKLLVADNIRVTSHKADWKFLVSLFSKVIPNVCTKSKN